MQRIIILFGLVLIGVTSFAYNPKLEKKIKKELNEVFDGCELANCSLVETYTDSIQITTEIFMIKDDAAEQLGYFAISQGEGRFEHFDFMIIYNRQKQIQKVKVLLYKSTYGYEIGNKRWLKQFNDKDVQSSLKYHEDIQAISGATVSVRGLIKGVNRVNRILADLP